MNPDAPIERVPSTWLRSRFSLDGRSLISVLLFDVELLVAHAYLRR